MAQLCGVEDGVRGVLRVLEELEQGGVDVGMVVVAGAGVTGVEDGEAVAIDRAVIFRKIVVDGVRVVEGRRMRRKHLTWPAPVILRVGIAQ